jgi:phosphatidylserine/phosphatidylglycerophosphate/cardiolipin synthase-like enzyme
MKKRIIFISIILLLSFQYSFSGDFKIITDRRYFQTVHRLFTNAKKSIKVIMFSAKYYDRYPNTPSNILIRDLISAKKRGIKVEIILEYRDNNDKNSKENKKTGEFLAKEGVNVVYDPSFVTTHAKVVIIDGEISIIGSTNWTYYSLTNNHEVSIMVRSKEVGESLNRYFEEIKESGHR